MLKCKLLPTWALGLLIINSHCKWPENFRQGFIRAHAAQASQSKKYPCLPPQEELLGSLNGATTGQVHGLESRQNLGDLSPTWCPAGTMCTPRFCSRHSPDSGLAHCFVVTPIAPATVTFSYLQFL